MPDITPYRCPTCGSDDPKVRGRICLQGTCLSNANRENAGCDGCGCDAACPSAFHDTTTPMPDITPEQVQEAEASIVEAVDTVYQQHDRHLAMQISNAVLLLLKIIATLTKEIARLREERDTALTAVGVKTAYNHMMDLAGERDAALERIAELERVATAAKGVRSQWTTKGRTSGQFSRSLKRMFDALTAVKYGSVCDE